MRKIFLLVALVCGIALTANAQNKPTAAAAPKPVEDTVAPYLKNPGLPAFNILMMDSTTIFNTYNIPEGKPVVIMFFSPDCGHCQRTMRKITRDIDSLEDVQFYLVTATHSMEEIKKFYDEHHLSKYKNIVMVGRDYEFFFGSFYGIKVVPDLAIYDAHKKIIKLIQGETNVNEIYNALHGKK